MLKDYFLLTLLNYRQDYKLGTGIPVRAQRVNQGCATFLYPQAKLAAEYTLTPENTRWFSENRLDFNVKTFFGNRPVMVMVYGYDKKINAKKDNKTGKEFVNLFVIPTSEKS